MSYCVLLQCLTDRFGPITQPECYLFFETSLEVGLAQLFVSVKSSSLIHHRPHPRFVCFLLIIDGLENFLAYQIFQTTMEAGWWFRSGKTSLNPSGNLLLAVPSRYFCSGSCWGFSKLHVVMSCAYGL